VALFIVAGALFAVVAVGCVLNLLPKRPVRNVQRSHDVTVTHTGQPAEPMGVPLASPVAAQNYAPEPTGLSEYGASEQPTSQNYAPASDRLLTLREAHQQGVVPVSLDALKRASTRGGFPPSRGKRRTGNGGRPPDLYSEAELADWGARRRPLAALSAPWSV
jgi:hypothetical protein